MRNQVITVPKRRPPRPHSCSRSRSPLRQLAAAKPNQVIKANNKTKIVRAVQFTSCTVSPLPALALVFGRKIHDCCEHSTDDYPKKLIPVEERHADPIGFCFVVKGRPEDGDKLDKKEQVPPAPRAPLFTWSVHRPLPKPAALGA